MKKSSLSKLTEPPTHMLKNLPSYSIDRAAYRRLEWYRREMMWLFARLGTLNVVVHATNSRATVNTDAQ